MPIEAASLVVNVGIDGVEKVTGGLNQADQAVQGFGLSASKILGGVVVAGAAAAVAGLGALGVSSVSAAATFEQSLSSIQAVSGATAAEMEQISSLALKLGADTAFSAQEAAAGFEELIKGGLSTADAMASAKPMLDLAAAGGISVANAAEIAANALGIFGLKGSDMTNVANQIAGAANASSLSVSDFQQSMAAAGSVAAGAGQTFDDLAVAIAVMGRNGIKGSDAGTSLKTMLLNLQPTTKAQIKLFDQLGLTHQNNAAMATAFAKYGLDPLNASMEDSEEQLMKAITGWDGMGKMTAEQTGLWKNAQQSLGLVTNEFINADGSFKSMSEIAEVLQTSMEGLTDSQRALALETIFGSDAIRAGNIFVKEGAEGFNEMAAAMGKVTAADVAATRMDNFRGAMDALSGSFETFQIVLGTAVLPLLTSLVADYLTPAINAMTTFTQGFFDAGDKFAFLTTAIDSVLPGFATLVVWLQETIPTAVAAATSVIQPLADTWIDRFNVILSTVQTVLPAVQSVVLDVLGIIAGFIQEHGTSILATLTTAWTTIQSTINTAITTVGSIIQTTFGIIAGFLDQNSASIQQTLGTVWTTVQSMIQTATNVISSVVQTVFGAVAAFLDQNSGSIQALLTTAWQTIQAVIQTAAAVIQNIIIPIFSGIASFLAAHKDTIVAILTGAWNLISSVITTALHLIQGVMQVVMAAVQGDWSGAWQAIQNTAATLWEDIKNVVSVAITNVQTTIQTVVSAIQSFLSGAWSAIQGAASAAWEAIKVAAAVAWEALKIIVSQKIGEVIALVQSLPGRIVGALGNLGGVLVSAGQDLIQGFINGIKSINVGSILGGIVSGAIGAAKAAAGIKSPSTVMRDEVGKPLIQGMIDGITAKAGLVRSTLLGLGSDIPDWVRDGVGMTQSAMKTAIMEPAHDAITQLIRDLKQPARTVGLTIGNALMGGYAERSPLFADSLATPVLGAIEHTRQATATPAATVGSDIATSIIGGYADRTPMVDTAIKDPLTSTLATALTAVQEPSRAVGLGIGEHIGSGFTETVPELTGTLSSALAGALGAGESAITSATPGILNAINAMVDAYNAAIGRIKTPDFTGGYADRGPNWDMNDLGGRYTTAPSPGIPLRYTPPYNEPSYTAKSGDTYVTNNINVTGNYKNQSVRTIGNELRLLSMVTPSLSPSA